VTLPASHPLAVLLDAMVKALDEELHPEDARGDIADLKAKKRREADRRAPQAARRSAP
jgi:hypothetical protein